MDEKSVRPFSDRSIYSYTLNRQRSPTGNLPVQRCPKKGRLIDTLRYRYCRVSSAAVKALSGCEPDSRPQKLDFAQFKRRRPTNLSVGGTERPGLSVYRGQRRTVKNPPTPATSGGAPERWHPRRSATAWRTTPLCAGSIRPLAWGLHAQVSPHLLEGDLQLPAQHKPFQALRRVHGQVSAQQSLGGEFALGVPNQDPAAGARVACPSDTRPPFAR